MNGVEYPGGRSTDRKGFVICSSRRMLLQEKGCDVGPQ